MQLTLPAATLATLLSSEVSLSNAQAVGLAKTAVEHESERLKMEAKVKDTNKVQGYWHDRSLLLKQKLKDKFDLRIKLSSQDYRLVKETSKECLPVRSDELRKGGMTDVGIFHCEPKSMCLEDATSSLGGTCAKVAKRDNGGVNGEGRNDFLKPLSMKDKMRAKSLLERIGGADARTGEECKPSSSKGYVDVGRLNPCERFNHVCVEDPLSSLGGTCVEIGSEDGESSDRELNGGDVLNRHLTECKYRNGTVGKKCSGLRACYGLSTHARNKIGCGSCNGYGSCIGLTENSSVKEFSCNGGSACRHDASLGNAASSVTISDKSCNDYYACSYTSGTATIGYDSCNGVYACRRLKGTSLVGSKSCNKDGACEYLSGNTIIGVESCSHCYSCTKTSGQTKIADWSCNELRSCSNTNGTTTILNSSCSGPYSCSFMSGNSMIGSFSCGNSNACANATGDSFYVGNSSCNGENACEGVSSLNFTAKQGSCNSKSSCRAASGDFILLENLSCSGDKSCYAPSAYYMRVKGGCNANYACVFCDADHFYVGESGCGQSQACNNCSGTVLVSSNSCTGQGTCSYSTGYLKIGKFSCTAQNACSHRSGYAKIESNSCSDYGACGYSSDDSYMLISSRSCTARHSCLHNSGTLVVSNDSCTGPGSCKNVSGQLTVQENSCTSHHSCNYIDGTVNIFSSSCGTEGQACVKLHGLVTIHNNSCHGVLACYKIYGTSTLIGESSCRGERACTDLIQAKSIEIATHSCVGSKACLNIAGSSEIDAFSCNGYRTCASSYSVKVYSGSCVADDACKYSKGITVGANSCRATRACGRTNSVEIGMDSCNSVTACYSSVGIKVGASSCNADDACAASNGIEVGANSCRATQACAFTKSVEIGLDSCNSFMGCSSSVGIKVGASSCNVDMSCMRNNNFVVHNESCNGRWACRDLSRGNVTIYSRSCNGHSACYNTGSSGPVGHMMIYDDSCNKDGSCSIIPRGASLVAGPHSCNGGGCGHITGQQVVHSHSCNNGSCWGTKGNLTVMKNSCNKADACHELGVNGKALIYSGSCLGFGACRNASDNFLVHANACNNNNACSDASGNSTVSTGSCLGISSCKLTSGQFLVQNASCNSEFSCSYSSGNTIVEEESCTGFKACSHASGITTIKSRSCGDSYACHNVSGHTQISSKSCDGPRSCSETPTNTTIGISSCVGSDSCSGGYGVSEALYVADEACNGDRSCFSTRGLTLVGKSSCVGVDACSGLVRGKVSEYSCLGVGSCMMPLDQGLLDTSLTVSENSCQGCYSCINITGSAIVGYESCLGFSACGDIAGNVSIGNGSCYGLKACFNNTEDSIVQIADGACVGARSCMSMTGHSTVSNTSCVGPQSCMGMRSGTVSYNSCTGKGACSKLRGDVSSFSCHGYYSCNLAGTVSSNVIGQNSCNAAFACQNNGAKIGDCLCLTDNECIDNITPMYSDGCAPSLSPAPSASSVPSSNPSSSKMPSAFPTATPSVSGNPSDSPSSSPSMCGYRKVQKVKIQSTTSEMIHMFEVNVLSHNGINLALGKSSNQSSTFVAKKGGNWFNASLAVDGISKTFSHTADSNSWWEVDLEGISSGEISSIDILNRWCQSPDDGPGCLCRLSDATVSMLDENDMVIASDSTSNTCDVSKVQLILDPCKPEAPTRSPALVSKSCFPHARKVKLQQAASGTYVQLFELRAISTMGINVAQGKSASQSSTFENPIGISFSASKVIDGNTNTFSHTGFNDPVPWLEVDLESIYEISSVQLLNRWCKSPSDPSNCLCRLSGATLLLLDDFGEEIISTAIRNTCGQSELEFTFDQWPEFCQDPTTSPTFAPTSKPSTYPSLSPTDMPSSSPSASSMPSLWPTTKPSSAPSTSASPTFIGPQVAKFDSVLRAPRCKSISTSCDTGSLIVGRGAMPPAEPNHPNTIDGCVDGNSGNFAIRNSLDRIVLRSGDIDEDDSDIALNIGGRATIVVTVFSSTIYDNCDFFYANDAFNPIWNYIGTLQPFKGGLQELKMAFTIPDGSETQAIRVQLSNGADDYYYDDYYHYDDDYHYANNDGADYTTCLSGDYNERDDLVFTVSPYPSLSPSVSFSPSLSALPSARPTITSAPSTSTSPTDKECFPNVNKVKLQQTTGDFLHVFELQVIDETGTNIALGKVATQSSLYTEDGITMVASRAVDDNMSTFSHTNSRSMGDQNPWLQIDLGSSAFQITSIIIHNRWCIDPNDVYECLCRLSEATLTLIDSTGAEIKSFSTGDSCSKATLPYAFDAAPEFCFASPSNVFRSNANANFRHSEGTNSSTSNTFPDPEVAGVACLPNAQKVRLQKLGVDKFTLAVELQVTSSSMNVAEGKTIKSSYVATAATYNRLENTSDGISKDSWEVDLGDSFLISSVLVLNSQCSEAKDPEKCLCSLSGATLFLIDESGEEITSVLAGGTCGQDKIEFVFDASAEFCKSTVSQISSPNEGQPGQAPTKWKTRSRALAARPKKCSG